MVDLALQDARSRRSRRFLPREDRPGRAADCATALRTDWPGRHGQRHPGRAGGPPRSAARPDHRRTAARPRRTAPRSPQPAGQPGAAMPRRRRSSRRGRSRTSGRCFRRAEVAGEAEQPGLRPVAVRSRPPPEPAQFGQEGHGRARPAPVDQGPGAPGRLRPATIGSSGVMPMPPADEQVRGRIDQLEVVAGCPHRQAALGRRSGARAGEVMKFEPPRPSATRSTAIR